MNFQSGVFILSEGWCLKFFFVHVYVIPFKRVLVFIIIAPSLPNKICFASLQWELENCGKGCHFRKYVYWYCYKANSFTSDLFSDFNLFTLNHRMLCLMFFRLSIIVILSLKVVFLFQSFLVFIVNQRYIDLSYDFPIPRFNWYNCLL